MSIRPHRWWLYLPVLALALGLITHEFRDARRTARPTTPGVLELIGTRRPFASADNLELHMLNQVRIRVEGLSHVETDPQVPHPWRHGLLPATRLIFAPSPASFTVRWAFDNQVPDQTLTVRCNGTILSRYNLPHGHHTGQAVLPPAASETTLELVFGHPIPPSDDPRAIMVTFTSLTVRTP